jgi:hypothetical protein
MRSQQPRRTRFIVGCVALMLTAAELFAVQASVSTSAGNVAPQSTAQSPGSPTIKTPSKPGSDVKSGTAAPAITVGEFAQQMQQKFALPQPAVPVHYADLAPSDPNYAAAQAITPFLNRQVLCPGCVLSANFGANQPLPRAAAAVFFVSVLRARNQIELLNASQANGELVNVPDAAGLPVVQRRYIATAIKHGLLPLHAGNAVHAARPLAPAELNKSLQKIQLQFKLTLPPRNQLKTRPQSKVIESRNSDEGLST